ncbi:hypothetical protein ACMYSK_03610 [Klebsiella sp. I138]|uniref:hypothetical protein n=1 Tax=Klebsiella sp. I138 TaxID=2755385 RepID=UPI003DA941EC
MAGALCPLAERGIAAMAQARSVCFIVVHSGRGIGYRAGYFLHNEAARRGKLHSYLAISYLA